MNDSGAFFESDEGFTRRMLVGRPSEEDRRFLECHAHLIDTGDPLELDAHAYGVAERLTSPAQLDYLILVPTLRCNLACTYCQVSRANEDALAFDWTADLLEQVGQFLDSLTTDDVKIEFQGGEPTLRPDLIEAVIKRCQRFPNKQFVICTNLQRVSAETLKIFDRADVYISTSLDGALTTHERNRTNGEGQAFFSNLKMLTERYGRGKIAALPTIDPAALPDIDELIDAFREFGLTRIFLRPINFHGFARKRHELSRELGPEWRHFYERFVRRLIELNWSKKDELLEETYFSICLRRIFQPHRDRHVDLRNPNPLGLDYLVIDYDGSIYPTDESRMLTRSRVVDLKLGRVGSNWKGETWQTLNEHSTNYFDEACQRCTYQPYCSRDIVDDLARYGRIDQCRTSTEFCRKHLWLFDLIFELIYDPDPAVQFSLRRWLRLRSEPVLGEVHA